MYTLFKIDPTRSADVLLDTVLCAVRLTGSQFPVDRSEIDLRSEGTKKTREGDETKGRAVRRGPGDGPVLARRGRAEA